MVTVPLTGLVPSPSPATWNAISSSDVAWVKAATILGAKKFIWAWEKTGVCSGVEIKISWSIPLSWLWDTPCKIWLTSGSERNWGCCGGMLKALDVCRAMLPCSLLWIGVSTVGVQEHWIVPTTIKRSSPHILRKEEFVDCRKFVRKGKTTRQINVFVRCKHSENKGNLITEDYCFLRVPNSTGPCNAILITAPQC